MLPLKYSTPLSCYVYVDLGFLNDKLLITYFCLYILLYKVSRSYFKILESLLKFAVSFDVLIRHFRTHTQIEIP